MSVIWSGITEEGAVVPVQVTNEGRVVATSGQSLDGFGATAWCNCRDIEMELVSGFGIESVDKIGTGSYRVEFTTPLVNDTYAVFVTSSARIGSAMFPDKNGFEIRIWLKGDGGASNPLKDGLTSIVVFCDGIPSPSKNLASKLEDIRDGVAEEADKPTTLPSFPENESQVVVTTDNDNAS